MEEEQNSLREMLEEEEEAKKNVEKQISVLQGQVGAPQWFLSKINGDLRVSKVTHVLPSLHVRILSWET